MSVRAGLGLNPAESSLLAVVSRASRLLASSLDYTAAVKDVAALVAEELSDACAIELLDSRGLIRTVATAGDPRALTGSGSSRRLDVPIVGREQRLGTLRLVDLPTRRRSLESVEPAAEEIALRIAVAVDSAHAFAREHRIADALQRALLPDPLPPTEAYRTHAAYLPATADSTVGGDWYDAFVLPDGRVAISIGDVAGHGLQAATIMGEVRQAFRASAFDPKSPAGVLERANTVLTMRSRPVMVTAIFGVYDPATATLTYATAGHPPPLLALRDGLVLTLPATGLPLGLGTSFESFDWTFTLPPGSLVILYTDGLIEHTRDILEGERLLGAAVEREIAALSANPAESLLRRIFPDGSNTDDVATLTLGVEDRAGEFSFTFSAIPLAAPLVRHALVDFARRLELDEETRFNLITTVGEAVANASEHAYAQAPGLVRVTVAPRNESLVVEVQDHGRWRPAQQRDERGRGLRLMRALAESVQILTEANGTTIRLTLPRADLADVQRA